MRLPALDAFLLQYESILNWLELLSSSSDIDSVSKTHARSHLGSLESFEVYYLLQVIHRLLLLINPIHTKVQRADLCVDRRNLGAGVLILGIAAIVQCKGALVAPVTQTGQNS